MVGKSLHLCHALWRLFFAISYLVNPVSLSCILLAPCACCVVDVKTKKNRYFWREENVPVCIYCGKRSLPRPGSSLRCFSLLWRRSGFGLWSSAEVSTVRCRSCSWLAIVLGVGGSWGVLVLLSPPSCTICPLEITPRIFWKPSLSFADVVALVSSPVSTPHVLSTAKRHGVSRVSFGS